MVCSVCTVDLYAVQRVNLGYHLWQSMSIFIFRSKLFFKTELNILEVKSIRLHIQSEHIESAVKFDLFSDHNILAVSSVKCEFAHRESVEKQGTRQLGKLFECRASPQAHLILSRMFNIKGYDIIRVGGAGLLCQIYKYVSVDIYVFHIIN